MEQKLHACKLGSRKENITNKIVPVDTMSISPTTDMIVSKDIDYSLADEAEGVLM